MNRIEFLKKLGFGGASLVAVYCSSCVDENIPLANVDFTLDLTLAVNSALNSNGGFVIKNRVVVARTSSGNFVAVTQVCSHEGQVQVSFRAASNDFQCSAHGATYNTAGAGTNANGSKGLTTYQTTLTGTSLRVFS
jgi:cytochrome b6-f complex iron-sulfur subunit